MNKRARKRARQQQEAEEAEERFRFALLAGQVLRGGGLADLCGQVVDVEIIPQFNGDPENMFAWLIFATTEDAAAAMQPETKPKIEERVHALLSEDGFPVEAVASFRIGYTSLPEIEAGGGRFLFFR
jgi:hypothetical protein